MLGTLLGHLFLETSSWKHLLENLFWEPCFVWENMFLEILLGKCCLETLKPGNLAWEPLPGNLAWEPCLGTSSWEPCLGTSCWEPLLGNLFLGTSWKPYLGTCSWEPCLETLLGNLFLGTRFPILCRADLAAPRDSLRKGDPSPKPGSQPCAVRIWLLRPAPEPLLWLKTPSLRCWGKKTIF